MKKTIGIIGGMGPAATVDLFHLIVENTSASCDQEHIHILIDCNTLIPDRTSAIINGTESPIKELRLSADRLVEAGADFLILPCNTAHYYIDEIREGISVPVIDMIEETARFVKQSGCSSAIILCTEGTRKTGVYTDRFMKQGIQTVYPDSELQEEVNRIIYEGVKNGRTDYDVSKFNKLLGDLEQKTESLTVLGCTELPIAERWFHLKGNFINPTYILACSAILEAGYRIKVSAH